MQRDKVVMQDAVDRKDEVREAVQEEACDVPLNSIRDALRKREQKLHFVPLVSLLITTVLVILIPYTRENIAIAISDLGYYFTVDSRVHMVAGDTAKEAENVFDPDYRNGPGNPPGRIKDGRLYMVIDNKWIDITDLCSATSYCRYEKDKGNGTKKVIIVGGLPEDNRYGWIEYIYDSKGERVVSREYMPRTGLKDPERDNADFEWAVFAHHNESVRCG